MNKYRNAVLALVAAACVMPGSAQAVDFDGTGSGGAAILSQFRNDARKIGQGRRKPGERDRVRRKPGHRDQGRYVYDHWSKNCKRVVFRPEDSMGSRQIRISSSLYERRCRTDNDGYRRCRDIERRTESRYVRLEVRGRGEMLPWERDVFNVCLQGYDVTARVLAGASHIYNLYMESGSTIVADAGRKVATGSDSDGMYAGRFDFDAAAGSFVLELRDKWTRYYQGEEVGIYVELKKNVHYWVDKTIMKKELTMPVGDTQTIRFADYASEFSQNLEHGKEYYVKWGFRRIGTVSTGELNEKEDTQKARYQSAMAMVR